MTKNDVCNLELSVESFFIKLFNNKFRTFYEKQEQSYVFKLTNDNFDFHFNYEIENLCFNILINLDDCENVKRVRFRIPIHGSDYDKKYHSLETTIVKYSDELFTITNKNSSSIFKVRNITKLASIMVCDILTFLNYKKTSIDSDLYFELQNNKNVNSIFFEVCISNDMTIKDFLKLPKQDNEILEKIKNKISESLGHRFVYIGENDYIIKNFMKFIEKENIFYFDAYKTSDYDDLYTTLNELSNLKLRDF